MKDYRVNITVKNNRILDAIEESGYSNVKEFCDINNICPTLIYQLTNLKVAPLLACGKIRAAVRQMCEALDKVPEELFSKEQMFMKLETNTGALVLDFEGVKEIMGVSKTLDEEQLTRDHKNIVSKLIPMLQPRLQTVIKMRYIDGQTLEQVGKVFNVTGARIRQMEARALRKLRNLSKKNNINESDI